VKLPTIADIPHELHKNCVSDIYLEHIMLTGLGILLIICVKYRQFATKQPNYDV